MTRRYELVVAAAALLVLVGTPRRAAAQAPPPVGGYLTFNVGSAQPVSGALQSEASWTDGVNRDIVTTESGGGNAPAFDIGGGVLLRDRLLIGATFEHSSTTTPADVTLSLNHPQYHPTLTTTFETDPLNRTDDALHVQVGYRIPVGRRFSLLVSGGPSYFTTRREVLNDLSYFEPFNPVTRTYSATIESVDTERVEGSAWGYNVGADASYYFSKYVGVGGVVRYGRATVSLEDPLQSLIDDGTSTKQTDVGGFRVGAGLRLRF